MQDHRSTPAPRAEHGPRPVDVDVLLLGTEAYTSERLAVPHREVANRRFVLVPLLELDPDLVLPDGTRLADALAALDGQDVHRAGPPLDVGAAGGALPRPSHPG